ASLASALHKTQLACFHAGSLRSSKSSNDFLIPIRTSAAVSKRACALGSETLPTSLRALSKWRPWSGGADSDRADSDRADSSSTSMTSKMLTCLRALRPGIYQDSTPRASSQTINFKGKLNT